MKFGVTGRAGGFEDWDPKEIPGMAKFVEELGFTGIWMQEEHFLQKGPSVCLSPHILGSVLAAGTTKLRIGFSVLLLPLHDPLRLAEEIATLDLLSGGRVDFGISRGYPGKYFDAYRVKATTRSTCFRESLEFMVDCWTKDQVIINGKKYSMEPKPEQKPHPPVYVATYSEENARWVARSEYRLIQHGIQSRTHLEGMIRAYESAGGETQKVPVSRFVYVGHDDSSARKEIWPVVCKLTSFLHAIGIFRHSFITEKELEPENFMDQMVILGGPPSVIEQLRGLRDGLGVEYLNSLVAFYGNLPPELIIRSLKNMSKWVIPLLR